MVVVTSSLALVLTTTLSVVRRQRDEVLLVRAMRSQLSVSLAGYDPDLYQEFGLFGADVTAENRMVFRSMVPARFSRADVKLKMERSVLDPDCLVAGIARTMQLRLPVLWISQLMPDTVGTQTDGDGIRSSDLAAVSDELNQPVLMEAASLLDGPLAQTLDQLQNDLAADGLDLLTTRIEPTLRDQMNGILDWVDEIAVLRGSLSGSENSLAVLGDWTTVLDDLSRGTTSAFWHQVELAEYGVAYLTREVTIQLENGVAQPIETVSGLKLEALTDRRPAELERIVTGQTDADQAVRQIKTELIALRSLIRLADLLSDPQQQKQIQTTAAAAAVAISAASGGAITIDPQLMSWLIMAGESIQQGLADYDALIQGKSVPMMSDRLTPNWPEMAYQDFLRLMLLTIPQDVLLARIGQVIGQALPGSFAHEISLQVTGTGLGQSHSVTPDPVIVRMAYDG